jgi:hypothetical protein
MVKRPPRIGRNRRCAQSYSSLDEFAEAVDRLKLAAVRLTPAT